MKKKIPLYIQIIIGLVLGLAYSILATVQGLIDFTHDWISPFGQIFINALKLLAVPLVLVSLIVGIASMNNIRTLGKMGGKSIFIYISTTVIAIIVGLFLVNTIQPGKFINDETRVKLVEKYSNKSQEKLEVATATKKNGPLQPLVDLVPSNFVVSASDNRNMLQVIFFAILFGIAMVMIPESKSNPARIFFESVNEIILKIVDIIMLYSPIGVFALLAGVLVQVSEGDLNFAFQILSGLGVYSLTVIIGLAIMVFVIYPFLIRRFAKVKFIRFIKAISPAQLLAFSTSSSAATLPLTMERVEEELNPNQYAEFYQTSNVSSSFVWVLTIIHFLHLILSLSGIIVVAFRANNGRYNSENTAGLKAIGVFWHFVGLLWLYLYVFLEYIN